MLELVRSADADADVAVLLADYRLEELMPLVPADAAPVRVEGSEAGRSFTTQAPVRAGDVADLVFVPVTARGDRIGVLGVRSRIWSDPVAVAALQQLARLLAPALLAGDLASDVYRMARRRQSLTLAAEMQWDTLPGRSLDVGYARIAGQLEPAYTVVGDVYDWTADPTGLSAALVDGSGHGSQAASNAVLTVAALRNARREGADLVGMARLADQALHSLHAGAMFSSTVLLDHDPAAGVVHLVVAGAGVVILADRGGARRLELDLHPPLGVEEDYPYSAQTMPLPVGSRLVVAGDGLVGAQVEDVTFGDRLERLVQGYRLLGCAELVRAVIRDLKAFHAGHPLLDDAVVLCLEAGPTAVEG